MKTVKDYNLPLNSLKHKQKQHEKISTVLFYQVYADTVRESKAQQDMGASYAFLPIKQVSL